MHRRDGFAGQGRRRMHRLMTGDERPGVTTAQRGEPVTARRLVGIIGVVKNSFVNSR
jgi:hypothetical protein